MNDQILVCSPVQRKWLHNVYRGLAKMQTEGTIERWNFLELDSGSATCEIVRQNRRQLVCWDEFSDHDGPFQDIQRLAPPETSVNVKFRMDPEGTVVKEIVRLQVFRLSIT